MTCWLERFGSPRRGTRHLFDPQWSRLRRPCRERRRRGRRNPRRRLADGPHSVLQHRQRGPPRRLRSGRSRRKNDQALRHLRGTHPRPRRRHPQRRTPRSLRAWLDRQRRRRLRRRRLLPLTLGRSGPTAAGPLRPGLPWLRNQGLRLDGMVQLWAPQRNVARLRWPDQRGLLRRRPNGRTDLTVRLPRNHEMDQRNVQRLEYALQLRTRQRPRLGLAQGAPAELRSLEHEDHRSAPERQVRG